MGSLYHEVCGFLNRHGGLAPCTMGRMAMGDPRFVHDLRLGRAPRPKTVAKLRAWMHSQDELAARETLEGLAQ